ncbi:hypothetical protein CRENBAI_012804 [Crenichthys baileyi]|uniref:Uncharacterized protein n=1 Tax=Crenichthys baileyi TaxID=28760 RepID=A0AAV9RS54_9TELE
MLPTRLHSGVPHNASRNRMFPPTTDPADKLKADALDRWVERQKEEAMRNLSTDLDVLPSPLLLEQMEREAAQRQRVREGCFVPPPQLRRSPPASVPAAKPLSSSRCRNRRRAGVNSRWSGEEVVSLPADVRAAASKPAPSSATAMSPMLTAAPPMPSSARCSEATPEELEERLMFFARQIKSFRKTSLLYFSPEQMQRIKQMEEDYETVVRLFYCRPPSPTPSHMSAAAEQPTSGFQSAAAAAEQPTSGLMSATAEQSTPGLQPAVEFPEGPEGGLPPPPGPEHLLFFLWGVLMELRPDAPQPDSRPGARSQKHHSLTPGQESEAPQPDSRPDAPQPDSRPDAPQPDSRPDAPQPDSRPDPPQPDSRPDPKSASTSSTRRRGRRKRDASAQVIGGPGDFSAPAHVTEGPADASGPAPSLEAFQGFSEKLVLILASEPCDEGFEEEAPPDPVPEGFKKQFVLVLASEPRDEGLPGAASASEGSPGAASASEGSPGSQPVYEAPGSLAPARTLCPAWVVFLFLSCCLLVCILGSHIMHVVTVL